MKVTIYFLDGAICDHGEERNLQAIDGLKRTWFNDGYIIKTMPLDIHYPPHMIKKVEVNKS